MYIVLAFSSAETNLHVATRQSFNFPWLSMTSMTFQVICLCICLRETKATFSFLSNHSGMSFLEPNEILILVVSFFVLLCKLFKNKFCSGLKLTNRVVWHEWRMSICSGMKTTDRQECLTRPHGGTSFYKGLMGMCHLMGSHFHLWIDYNGVAFSIQLLEWGHTFSDFWGKTALHTYG